MDTGHLKLIEEMKQCIQCDLSSSRTQVVVGQYGPKEGICFIGEAPGKAEDLQGEPFVGRSGQLLNKMLNHIGQSRDQVSILNIVKCRPPGNRNPNQSEMNICGQLWLKQQLSYLNPSLIVTLGSVPLSYFYSNRRVTRSKGKLLTSADFPVYPLYHPAYVLRGGSTRAQYETDFKEMWKTYQQINRGELTFEGKTSSTSSSQSAEGQSSLENYF